MSDLARSALLDGLHRTVEKLRWEPAGTPWADYSDGPSYSAAAFESKLSIVEDFLRAAGGSVVWDLGANNGRFSALAAGLGRTVIALDGDQGATEQHYQALKGSGSLSTLPLVADLVNPSPALGWAHTERKSLVERANADVVLALALVHHLAIGTNVTFDQIANFFAKLGSNLIVEFIPKSDPMAQALLRSRQDVFTDYSQEKFEAALLREFRLVSRRSITDSTRTLYLMRKADTAG